MRKRGQSGACFHARACVCDHVHVHVCERACVRVSVEDLHHKAHFIWSRGDQEQDVLQVTVDRRDHRLTHTCTKNTQAQTRRHTDAHTYTAMEQTDACCD